MISKKSVWIAFVGLFIGEIVIGCQQTEVNPQHGQLYTRASGRALGAPAPVPPLQITVPPAAASPEQGPGTGAAAQRNPSDTPMAVPAAEPFPPLPALPPALAIAPETPKGSGQPQTIETAVLRPENELHKLDRVMMEQAAQLNSYIVRFRQHEFLNGKQQPDDVIRLSFRKQPFSIHMQWLAPAATEGREVLYVKDHYENKLNLVVEKNRFLGGGSHMALALDSPLMKDHSRHTITDAGIHESVYRLHRVFAALEQGDKRLGTLVYHGATKRPEFPGPVEMVEHIMPPGHEPLLPQGGRRFVYVDPVEKLPTLVITQDETGREVEYYCYDCLQRNVKLDDIDFSPEQLGSAKK